MLLTYHWLHQCIDETKVLTQTEELAQTKINKLAEELLIAPTPQHLLPLLETIQDDVITTSPA